MNTRRSFDGLIVSALIPLSSTNKYIKRRNGMFRSILVIVICISGLSAEDIQVSKDSLQAYNSDISSKADAVIFRSNTASAIHLDSAHIIMEEMGKMDVDPLPAGHSMEVAWNANPTSDSYFVWTMDSIGNSSYRLNKKYFYPAEAAPLSFKEIGDSIQIFKLSIAYCFVCETRPYYPRSIKGNMKLHFSNGQEIVLRLYSDDLRTPVTTSPRRGSIETCLFGDSLDFSLINDTCQKRNMSGGSCSFNTCAVLAPDVRITQNTMYAPKGILFLGRCSDTNCLDTLKRVPVSGYLDSVDFGNFTGGHVFAVKTSEMNYAAVHLLYSGSGLPFRRFKWVYQPDSTADFIKVTSVQTTRRTMNTTLRNLKTISKRDNILISWTPINGAMQFRLFDLKGRQLHYWECDGRHGAMEASLKALKMAHSMHMLQILLHDEAEIAKENCILLPR